MYDQDVLKKIIELFYTISEAEEISAESELIEDLDLSSMDVMFLISSLEEEFHVSVPEKEIRKMVTVGDVVQIIQDLRK